MNAVKVSPKYQVVIPKQVRESLRIKPGQRLQMLAYNGHITLVPLVPIKKLRGLLKGMDTTIVREPDRI